MKSDFSSTIDVGNIKENPKQAQEGKRHLIFWEVRGRQIQISEQNECVTRVEMAGWGMLYKDQKTSFQINQRTLQEQEDFGTNEVLRQYTVYFRLYLFLSSYLHSPFFFFKLQSSLQSQPYVTNTYSQIQPSDVIESGSGFVPCQRADL